MLFVDLASVTVISPAGAQAHVLRDLKNRGVEFICCGVYFRHVLRNLKTLRETGTE
jgi:anti-anti-sigma regulatory factor